VIVQVDGGHTASADKRSFEALSGVVYRPASAGLTNIIVRLIARAWPYQLMIT